MFSESSNGRNRHRPPKPLFSGGDSVWDAEWGVTSPRPLSFARLSKRKPSKRVLALVALLFVAGLYGVRSWRNSVASTSAVPLETKGDKGKQKELKYNGPPGGPKDPRPRPPLFGKWHEAELALPQHHVEDPFAGGKKYLWVENHVHALGWGNHVQDLVFNAVLAHNIGRAFVFDNFTWNRDGSEYSDYNGKLIPSQIPLSALISGPLVGGPFLENDSKLRAIQREYWHKICPNPRTIWTQDVKKIINNDQATAKTILETWVEHFKSIDEPCIAIDGGTERIFDMYLYGQKERLLDIWPVIARSPIVKLYGYSPLIHSAFEANRDLFTSLPLIEPYFPCSGFSSSSLPATSDHKAITQPNSNPPQRCNDPYTPIRGLLALHLRRGDFVDHCKHLAKWNAAWMGFNSFPEFPDQWEIPPGGGWGESTPEHTQIYLDHCYPTISQIVKKITSIRATPAGKGLKDVYIMTNGDVHWVGELKEALRKMGGWEKIASSRDMTITKEQKEVAQAVDMMIGERAQVMVGNGWSSMSSNIVMMRMVRGMPPESNRFW